MRLNNGFEIPQIGIGTWSLRGETARQNVRLALQAGFRHVDTAQISEKMREADGLLIGSPVYFASPNGTQLSLLDRLFYSNLHADWSMKVGASVSIARRGGATTTMDVLNKYFLKTNMPVVPSQYWSIAHGTDPGEVVCDEEGMQTMRQLGLNMAFMIKSIRLGLQQFGSPKILEELIETNYIR